MPNLNVQLTDELDRFISRSVEEGIYNDASELVCSALEALEREQLAALREAIAEGDASGVARGDVIGRVKREARLLTRNS